MKMLIIVDMLNDFLDSRGKLDCGDAARKIIPSLVKRLQKAREEGDRVVFLKDKHLPDDLEFKKFPPHCLAGTWGAEIIDELCPLPSEYVITKTRYSGFYGTALDSLLDESIDEVVVSGVCTNICVMDTVGGLSNRDYKVIVPRDCVADFDPAAHEFALKRMASIYGAQLI